MLSLVFLPAFALPQQPQVYFGNLHSHTSYSDGSGTPEEAYKHARDVAHLDFLAITEHNHAAAESSAGDRRDGKLIATDATLYPKLRTAAQAATSASFVALYGQEFSSISKGNHVNVFDVGEVINETAVPNGDFKKLHTWLSTRLDSMSAPAILQFNHPSLVNDDTKEYGRDDFGSFAAWVDAIGAHACLIELLNGPALTKGTGMSPEAVMESDYRAYLNRGFHLAPTGNQDNHYRTWGSITDARTAVVATSLSKASILEALRARHVYATEDRNLRVVARVNGNLMGDRTGVFPAHGIELVITGTITDDDEPNAIYKIDVFADDHPGGTEAQIAETTMRNGPGAFAVSGVSFTGEGQYVFLRVTQVTSIGEDEDADRAWTAPVWFDGAAVAPPPLAAIAIASVLPNPFGSDLEFEEATIRNTGTAVASLVGWTLRDKSKNVWKLDDLGELFPGASKTIVRHGQSMAMNNDGGERIELVSPTGATVDQLNYDQAAPGQVIVKVAP